MGTTMKATAKRPTAKPAAPKLAERRPLMVVAQASYPPSGSLLILQVDVRDSTGAPVKGLGKPDFHVLEMPGNVKDLPVTVVQDRGASDSKRAGLYSLSFQSWSAPTPGVIAYRIRVQQGANSGVAMTSIVAR